MANFCIVVTIIFWKNLEISDFPVQFSLKIVLLLKHLSPLFLTSQIKKKIKIPNQGIMAIELFISFHNYYFSQAQVSFKKKEKKSLFISEFFPLTFHLIPRCSKPPKNTLKTIAKQCRCGEASFWSHIF
jgi:hypothetical protein